jgi:hypothetical protein
VPFITFKSFIERDYKYYHQDPIAALKIHENFLTIKEKSQDWPKVLRGSNIKWLIFRPSEPKELAVFRQYQNESSILLRNRDWVVLEVHVSDHEGEGRVVP